MDIYNDNMEVLKEKKQYLYKKLQELQGIEEDLTSIELMATLDGNQTLVLTKDEMMYRLNSMYSPTHEASRWVKQFDLLNLDVVVSMYGFGNGIFVREVLSTLGDMRVLLVYEPSIEVFQYVLEHCDIRDLLENPRLSITVKGMNDMEFGNMLGEHISWFNLKSQVVTTHPIYEMVFGESANIFYKKIQDNNNKAIANKNTDVALSRMFILNTLRNLKQIDRCSMTTELRDRFPKEVPAIIVAAGPSLDKNIGYIQKAKGKAVIFAVDTAVKYLLAENIIPDFIVTLDPKKSLVHLHDPRCKEIPIFGRMDSRPSNLINCEKNIFLYNIEGYMKSVFSRMNQETDEFQSGGSVATGAFSVCYSIGFRRIILVGQDLAYNGEDTHAGGMKVDASNGARQIEIVEGVDGNPVKTRYDWYVYLRWFEESIAVLGDVEVIDATEGGAKIHGTMIMDLEEAIDLYCTSAVSVDSILASIDPIINEDNRQDYISLLNEDLKDLNDLKSMAVEAYWISERLINKYQKSVEETPASVEKNRRLQSYNQKMESKSVYPLVDLDIAAETADDLIDMYVYTMDKQQNKIKTYEQGKIIYKAIENAVGRIQPLFIESIKYLEEK